MRSTSSRSRLALSGHARRNYFLPLWLCAIIVAGVPVRSQSVTVETLLSLAGDYVTTFAERFSNVVSEEHYTQEASARTSGVNQSKAVLRSEFLLARVPGVTEWIPFRDVFEANGLAVRDRESRLRRLFASGSGTAMEQAREITNQSARYNIGNVARTINNPLVALAFLLPDKQDHFTFSQGKADSAVKVRASVLDYREQRRPTLIRGYGNADLPASGRVWIDAATGAVVRTELILEDGAISAKVVTTFKPDGRLRIHVPDEMIEEYRLTGGGKVTGKATYSRFRQFAVETEETISKPDTPR